MIRSKSAENNRTKFWKLVKNVRNPKQANTIAIKNRQGKVVQELDDVVEAWRDHFSTLSKDKPNPKYDETHHALVTKKVKEWAACDDSGTFLSEPLTPEEVKKAIKKLNKNKAAGCDSVTTEHLQYAGFNFVQVF